MTLLPLLHLLLLLHPLDMETTQVARSLLTQAVELYRRVTHQFNCRQQLKHCMTVYSKAVAMIICCYRKYRLLSFK